LEKHFPQALEQYDFVTVFDLLIKYIKEGLIKLDTRRIQKSVTYHDPCNYGRRAEKRFGHGYFEEPRWILGQCVAQWEDLYPSALNQFCCGGGGGALVNGYNDERIHYGRRKMAQIRATGAEMVVMPCHSCHGQINNLKTHYEMEDLEVKYLWELVADCLIL
jgi:Fe-S oxidoreductase